MEQTTNPHSYVLPSTDGWSIQIFNDPQGLANGTIIPLPLTTAVSLDDALTFARKQPIHQDCPVIGGFDQ